MEDNNNSKDSLDFIRTIVVDDLRTNKHQGNVVTRFPPEPNGYLHIGHAKSICLNFGIALQFNGRCHLRFDDSNPCKEDIEYVNSIRQDVKWLGFDWGKHEYYASEYFEQMYQHAEHLIKKGLAYVCSLSADEVRKLRGTPTEPGKPSPYRDRSIEENLDLFRRMKNGEFPDGSHILRAKIDMASGNLNMRDPALYRIRHATHHSTGDTWCIYPMYDFCHCISDSIEGITHSICTLEFEDHRPLYDWILDNLDVDCHPQQIEFARLNVTQTVMSKRKLLELVRDKHVLGWDDPRMPTLAGMRRRGYTPESIREFCNRIGVAKANSTVDRALLDFCLREDLNKRAPRAMAVIQPLKLVIENYPEDKVEEIEVTVNPEDKNSGTRKVQFCKELFIEQDDFREDPPKKYFRLAPGTEVRLKHAYYIKCTSVSKDSDGNITEVRCTYDPETKGGWSSDGRKVMGTLHWVSARHAVDAEIRLYGELFTCQDPCQVLDGEDFTKNIDKNSLEVIQKAKVEPSLMQASAGDHFQFLRLGYFCADLIDHTKDNPVFNRIVTLKDTWAKLENKQA